MPNTTLTADIIAAEATMILENELCMAKLVHRGHESEFKNSVNGYNVGDTVTIRRPTDFTVGTSADITSAIQEVVEGSTSITVNQIRNVAFQFTSQELALDIKEVSDRQIKPAMIQLANAVDTSLMGLYTSVPNWVGTPGQTINSFGDFAKAPERLDELAVMKERNGVLSPADNWGLVGSQTGLYIQGAANEAYRRGALGEIAGVDTYMSQNVPTHTRGTWAGTTIAVDGAVTTSTITYAAVKDTMTQTITIDGFTAAAPAVAVGDVFEITDVWAVNPVTKARLPFRKQFTVTAVANASGNQVDVTFYPAMIWTGAQKTVDVTSGVTDLDGKVVIPLGSDATGYRQNMVFHKNAFALAMVPLPIMPGSVGASRKSHNGVSVRITPVYNGLTDVSVFRADILYGVKAIDPRLATRISGSA